MIVGQHRLFYIILLHGFFRPIVAARQYGKHNPVGTASVPRFIFQPFWPFALKMDCALKADQVILNIDTLC